MVRYEVLLLAVPEITQDEISSIETEINKVMKKFKASLVSFERWGKYRLAFPVRKNEYGVYFLLRFEAEDTATATPLIADLEMYFKVKLHEVIMRHMVTVLDATASLAYQRPQSLEEAPAHDVDTFLKENKMEGLMSNDKRSSMTDDLDADDEDLDDEPSMRGIQA